MCICLLKVYNFVRIFENFKFEPPNPFPISEFFEHFEKYKRDIEKMTKNFEDIRTNLEDIHTNLEENKLIKYLLILFQDFTLQYSLKYYDILYHLLVNTIENFIIKNGIQIKFNGIYKEIEEKKNFSLF